MLQLTEFLAPQALLRGAFCCLFSFFLSHCDSKHETPDWPEPKEELPSSRTESKARALAPVGEETSFMVYNLRNYLSMAEGCKQ